MTNSTTISISCEDCRLKETESCEDCLVSFVLGHDPCDAVVVDVEEARALRMLSCAGLVPALRHSSAGPQWPRPRPAGPHRAGPHRAGPHRAAG